MPRPTRSVATRMRFWPSLKACRFFWFWRRCEFLSVSGVFLSFLFFPLLSPFFSLSSRLSYLVDREPLVLLHPAVDARRGEVALAQEAVELLGSRDRADKDDDLVEVERVEQVVELAVLLALAEHHVVLHEAVQRELGLVVDVDLHRLFLAVFIFFWGGEKKGKKRGKKKREKKRGKEIVGGRRGERDGRNFWGIFFGFVFLEEKRSSVFCFLCS